MTIEAGQTLPPFSLPTDAGTTVGPADFAGRKLVLYFYPKDDTSGCTLEARGFTDRLADFAAADTAVVGVSKDGVKSHAKFRDKYQLPYRLLADDGHRLAEAYGVWIPKSFRGRDYFGNERTTFVIGPDGRIETVLAQVKPDAHVEQLLDVLAA